MRRDITRIRVWDIIPMLLVAALAAMMLVSWKAGRQESLCVTVRSDSGTEEYPLAQDRTFEVRSAGHVLSVEIKDGAARVVSSDCPDKVCVHTSPITKDGGTIVCVPAKVIITAEGGDGDELDWTAP